MTAVFLSGVMALAPVAEMLIGAGAEEAETLLLENCVVVELDGQSFPICVERTGDWASGLLLRGVDEALFRRLRFVAGALRMRPHQRTIGDVEATVFLAESDEFADAERWAPETWTDLRVAFVLNALREIAAYEGRFGQDDLAWRMPMIEARAEAKCIAAAYPAPTERRSAVRSGQVAPFADTLPHAGFFLTRAVELRHPSLSGGMSPLVRREVFVATDAAIVLPYDPVRDRVLLVEQFRMGPWGRDDPFPFVLEPVAGRVDANETPEEAARRECKEEAGLTLHRIEHVSSHYCSPGCSTEFFHCYLGLCDLPVSGTGQGGLADEHEDIRTHVIDFAEALDLVRTGEANNGPLVLILLWLERERARLRSVA